MTARSVGPVEGMGVMMALGIAGMQGHGVRGHHTGERWSYEHTRFGRHALATALSGGYSLDARGLRRCSVGILDIDHHVPENDNAAPDIGAWERHVLGDRASRRATTREWTARRWRGIVTAVAPKWEAFRRVCEAAGVVAIPESSPGGMHIAILYGRLYPVAWIRGHVLDLCRSAGLEVKPGCVEVFPDAGRLPRLPCTGPGRLLFPDLSGPKNRRRIDDVRELLAARRHVLEGRPEDAALNGEALLHGNSGERSASQASREGAYPKVFGQDFADQILDALEQGIPAGYSKVLSEKITFALRPGYPVSRERVMAVHERILAMPHHTCRAVESSAGRREYLARVKSHLKYIERGLAARDLTLGRLRNPELRAALSELLGEHDVSRVRTAAVRARWDKARYNSHQEVEDP